MDEQRWQRIETLFHDASALPADQQAVWLSQALGGDRELEEEVLRLLAGDRRSEHTVRRLIADASSDLVSGGIGPRPFATPASARGVLIVCSAKAAWASSSWHTATMGDSNSRRRSSRCASRWRHRPIWRCGHYRDGSATRHQHLAQLRQLSGRLLFQVRDAVESLPGATKARELLVTTSAEYLDGLSASAGSDPAFLMDLGASYDLGGPNGAHLGRPDEAMARYRKAWEIYQRLDAAGATDPELPRRKARTLVSLGRLQALNGRADEAEKTLMAANGAARAATMPGQVWPPEATEALLYLGDHFFDKAQPNDALGYYRQALIYVGNLPAARDEFQITLQRARDNAAANPNTAERVSAADEKDMRARRDVAEMNASHAAPLWLIAPDRAFRHGGCYP